jgi:hypothetical protein
MQIPKGSLKSRKFLSLLGSFLNLFKRQKISQRWISLAPRLFSPRIIIKGGLIDKALGLRAIPDPRRIDQRREESASVGL